MKFSIRRTKNYNRALESIEDKSYMRGVRDGLKKAARVCEDHARRYANCSRYSTIQETQYWIAAQDIRALLAPPAEKGKNG